MITSMILGIFLMVLLLIAPLGAMIVYDIPMQRQMFLALVRMILRLAIIGGAIHLLLTVDSVWLDMFFIVLFIGYSVLFVAMKSGLGLRIYGLPIASGMAVASLIVGLCIAYTIMSEGASFATRYAVPMVAIMTGGIVVPMSKSLVAYYKGLLNHNRLYFYMLGNGATSGEALAYLGRRAMQSALIPGIKNMTGMAAGVVPVAMWTMIACGVDAISAVMLQLLIVLGVYAASVLAVFVAIAVARRYVVDGYGRIVKS